MVKRLFGRLQLETGGKIAAWIELVGSLLFLAYVAHLAIEHFRSEYDIFYGQFHDTTAKMLLCTLPVIACSISLLYGIHKRRRYFLIPWLLINGIFLPFTLGVFAIFFQSYFFGHIHFYLFELLVAFGVFSLCGILIYIWFGVHSLYQIIYQEDKKRIQRLAELRMNGMESPYEDVGNV